MSLSKQSCSDLVLDLVIVAKLPGTQRFGVQGPRQMEDQIRYRRGRPQYRCLQRTVDVDVDINKGVPLLMFVSVCVFEESNQNNQDVCACVPPRPASDVHVPSTRVRVTTYEYK